MLFYCNLLLWFSFGKTFFFFFFFFPLREKLHIATLYIRNYFLSLFWQILPKSQYLFTECGVPKPSFTLSIRELFSSSDFSSTVSETLRHVCKDPLWKYFLSMTCMYCSLGDNVWQNKYFTSLTPCLSLMRLCLELGAGAKDARETRMDLRML